MTQPTVDEVFTIAAHKAQEIVDSARQHAEALMFLNSEERTEAIAERASEKAISGFFTKLGVDTNDPINMQKDFAYLRAFRESIELVKRRSLISAVTVIVTGAMAALYAAFSHKF